MKNLITLAKHRVTYILTGAAVFGLVVTSARAEISGQLSPAQKGELQSAQADFVAQGQKVQQVYDAERQLNNDKLDGLVKIMKVFGADVAAQTSNTWLKTKQTSTVADYTKTLKENFGAENLVPSNEKEEAMIRQIFALIGPKSTLSDAQKHELLLLIEKYFAAGVDKDKAVALNIKTDVDSKVALQNLVTQLGMYAKDSGGNVPADIGDQIEHILAGYHASVGSDLTALQQASGAGSKLVGGVNTATGALNEQPSLIEQMQASMKNGVDDVLTDGLAPDVQKEAAPNSFWKSRAPASTTVSSAAGLAAGQAALAAPVGDYYGGGLSIGTATGAAPATSTVVGNATIMNHSSTSDFGSPNTGATPDPVADTRTIASNDEGNHAPPSTPEAPAAGGATASHTSPQVPTTQPATPAPVKSNDDLSGISDRQEADDAIAKIFDRSLVSGASGGVAAPSAAGSPANHAAVGIGSGADAGTGGADVEDSIRLKIQKQAHLFQVKLEKALARLKGAPPSERLTQLSKMINETEISKLNLADAQSRMYDQRVLADMADCAIPIADGQSCKAAIEASRYRSIEGLTNSNDFKRCQVDEGGMANMTRSYGRQFQGQVTQDDQYLKVADAYSQTFAKDRPNAAIPRWVSKAYNIDSKLQDPICGLIPLYGDNKNRTPSDTFKTVKADNGAQCLEFKSGDHRDADNAIVALEGPISELVSEFVMDPTLKFNPYESQDWVKLSNATGSDAFTKSNLLSVLKDNLMNCPAAGHPNSLREMLIKDFASKSQEIATLNGCQMDAINLTLARQPELLRDQNKFIAALRGPGKSSDGSVVPHLCENLPRDAGEQRRLLARVRAVAFLEQSTKIHDILSLPSSPRQFVANVISHFAGSADRDQKHTVEQRLAAKDFWAQAKKDRDGNLSPQDQQRLHMMANDERASVLARLNQNDVSAAQLTNFAYAVGNSATTVKDQIANVLSWHAEPPVAQVTGPAATGALVAEAGLNAGYENFNERKASDVTEPVARLHLAGATRNSAGTKNFCSKDKPDENIPSDSTAVYQYVKKQMQQNFSSYTAETTEPRKAYLQAAAVSINKIARFGKCMAPEAAAKLCVKLQVAPGSHDLLPGGKIVYQFLSNLLDYSVAADSYSLAPSAAALGSQKQFANAANTNGATIRLGGKENAETDAADLAGGMNNFKSCLADPNSGASKFLLIQEKALRTYVAANCTDHYAKTVESSLASGRIKTFDNLLELDRSVDRSPGVQPTKTVPAPDVEGLEGFTTFAKRADSLENSQQLCRAMRSRYHVVLGLITSNRKLGVSWVSQVTPTDDKRTPAGKH